MIFKNILMYIIDNQLVIYGMVFQQYVLKISIKEINFKIKSL